MVRAMTSNLKIRKYDGHKGIADYDKENGLNDRLGCHLSYAFRTSFHLKSPEASNKTNDHSEHGRFAHANPKSA
jgi:hypothetical protein